MFLGEFSEQGIIASFFMSLMVNNGQQIELPTGLEGVAVFGTFSRQFTEPICG
jgi:hypothetical protein